MASRLDPIWLFVMLQILACQIRAQKCIPASGDQTEDVKFPDISSLRTPGYKSYKMMVVTNDIIKKQSHYVTETYDMANARGRLDVETADKSKPSKIVYFEKTNEIFFATKSSCKCSKISNLRNDKFSQDYNVWRWVDNSKGRALVGPSNMLRQAFIVWKLQTEIIGKEKEQVNVRGIKADVWTWCVAGTDITVKIYFSDVWMQVSYDWQEVAVPVRVTVQGLVVDKRINQTYDFLNLQLGLPEKLLESAIAIPRTLGCKRLEPDAKQVPSYDQRDLSVDAEVVYTPFQKNDKNYTYVSNLRVITDRKSRHVLVETTPWKAHADAEMAQPGDDLLYVLDTQHLFVYKIDKSQDSCSMKVFLPDETKLTLPDGFKLDPVEVIIGTTNDTGYHYLGEGVERGIPVSIFEKYEESEETLETKISTRYHIADGTFLESEFKERNAPLRMDYWNLLGDQEFTGYVAVNFFAFQSTLTKKNKLFDVRACFKEDTQSKWIQLVFPMDGQSASDVIPLIPYVQENFQGLLQTVAVGMDSPLRMPSVMVDVDKRNLFVTALILERPPFMLDFIEMPGNLTLKTVLDTTRVTGLTTLDDCAKSCIQEISCPYFSYCGAICTVSTSLIKDLPAVTESSESCTLYQSLYQSADQESLSASIPTMDEISKSIASAVETRSIALTLPVQDKILELTANLFKDDFAFGLEGLSRKPEGSLEDRFSVYKYGVRFDDSAADESGPISLGKVSFATCKQFCVDTASCESLSYCMATQDCALSSLHGEDIPQSHFQDSTQCMVISRNYADYFQRFPGISLDHEAEKILPYKTIESCAKGCKKEGDFDCKSFDFCPSNEDNDDKFCLLHKEHFTDIKEATHLNADKKCGHYSRKYAYDFKMSRHKAISDGNSLPAKGFQVANVSAERCAQMCQESGQCKGFYHCLSPLSFSSSCTLVSFVVQKMIDSSTCTAFVAPDGPVTERPRTTVTDEWGSPVTERLRTTVPDRLRTTVPRLRTTVTDEWGSPVTESIETPGTDQPVNETEIVEVHFKEEGHSKSSTGGLGFLMFLIGLALGIGAVFGYGYYKANRRVV